MPGGPSAIVLKDLHTLFQVGTAGGLTDGQLIERFLNQRDNAGKAAFRALVERHAPMVLRICRDVVGKWHDAEDASQATFIVLACKAGSIRKRHSVASWLFGVAYRVAAQAKAKASRRRRHEERTAELAGATIALEDTHMSWLELYEEIDRLPELLRGPLVLCYLKGHSQPEAAVRLGCPVRTLQNRLARGQKRLRSRLTRRGLHPALGLWTASMGQGESPAPVPVAWLEKTTQAAVASARHVSTAGLVSASVAALTEEMLRMMFRTKLMSIGAGVLAAAMPTVGMGMLAILAAGAPPQDKRVDGTVKATTRVAGGEIIIRAVGIAQDAAAEGFQGITAIDPETGKWRSIYKGITMRPGPVSPDGRYIARARQGPDLSPDEIGVWIYDMKRETPPRRIFDRYGVALWSSNGQQVVIGTHLGERWDKIETWRVNADGTGLTKLPIPDTDQVFYCSVDGTWLATRTASGDPRNWGRLTLIRSDGTGARNLTQGSASDDRLLFPRISPDGQRFAYIEVKTLENLRRSRLFVADIDGKNRREIPVAFEPGTTVDVCWAPDGSRLALNLSNQNHEGTIAVVNLDGTNFRNVPLPPGRWNPHVIDWQILAQGIRGGAPDEPDVKTPRGRLQALLQEVSKAAISYEQASVKAQTSEKRSRIYQDQYPFAKPYVGRFLDIAYSAPNDPAALDALVRAAIYAEGGPAFSRAIDVLAERYAATPKGSATVATLALKAAPAAEKMIRAVIEKNTDPWVKGAPVLLGLYLKRQAERIRDIREDPEAAKAWEILFLEQGSDKQAFDRFRDRDPDAMMKEAEASLERVGREFMGLPNYSNILSNAAVTRTTENVNSELYEIRNLSVGKSAPEITGEDIDAKPFKLSDYRGKVVYLTFWAEWSEPSRTMLPLERSQVERMQGKPFVLLGVNGDSDKAKLRELMKRENINLRSWYDGGGKADNPGPIARRFYVSVWPTTYIIDHRGIIRHKMLGNPASKKFSAAIDALVADAISQGFSASDRPESPSGLPASAPEDGQKPRL